MLKHFYKYLTAIQKSHAEQHDLRFNPIQNNDNLSPIKLANSPGSNSNRIEELGASVNCLY